MSHSTKNFQIIFCSPFFSSWRWSKNEGQVMLSLPIPRSWYWRDLKFLITCVLCLLPVLFLFLFVQLGLLLLLSLVWSIFIIKNIYFKPINLNLLYARWVNTNELSFLLIRKETNRTYRIDFFSNIYWKNPIYWLNFGRCTSTNDFNVLVFLCWTFVSFQWFRFVQ